MAVRRTSPVRLVDIAAKAGVSATVVSTVLRGGGSGGVRVAGPTAQRIRRIAERMNYQPNLAAQLLKGKRSDVLGVLIGAESTTANYERLAALEHAAYRRGYRLMIGHFRGDSGRTADYIQDFLARGVGGLICFHNPLPEHDARVLDLLRQVRHLVFQTDPLLDDACCVDVDRAAGVREAVDHLHATGRQRIALVLDHDIRDRLMKDRLDGYLDGLAAHGQQPLKSRIWTGLGGLSPAQADAAVRAVHLGGGADAIIASNDVWAIELIKALRRAGRQAPRDVAVIGFDNLPAAALFDPALTSIDQNNDIFADAVIKLILRSIEDGKVPAAQRTVIVPPRLIIRESA